MRENLKVPSFLMWLTALVLLGACTTNVTVTGTLPTPLVQQMPLRAGVYYSDEFKGFKHEEKVREKGPFKISLGAQNLLFFRNMFGAMFASVIEIEELTLDDTIKDQLDIIVVPQIIKYGFLSPSISGLNFYSASIHYRMTLQDTDGRVVGDWVVVGYGKSPSRTFGQAESLGDASMLAIRDGGARIAIETRNNPGLRAWAKSRNIEL